MRTLITSLIIIAACYIPLRFLLAAFYQGGVPKGFATLGGVLAWMTILSLIGPLYALWKFFERVIDHPSMGLAFEFAGMMTIILVGADVAARFPEVLDLSRMRPFFLSLLQFEDFSLRRENIFEAVEKKEIRDLYREQTGKDLVDVAPKEYRGTGISPEQALKELEEHRKKALHAPSVEAELETLRSGGFVDLTETFQLNALRRRSHPWYENVRSVRLDASTHTLGFEIAMPWTAAALSGDRGLLHAAKQKTFELIRFVWLEPWLKPFAEFVQSVTLICQTPSTDDFGLLRQTSFMRVLVPAKELRKREGRTYHPPELEPLSTISFEDVDHRPTK